MVWHVFLGIDSAVQHFTAFIIDAASKCISQSSSVACKCCVPWWNDEGRKASKKTNKVWGLLYDAPIVENLINFKQVTLQGRRMHQQARGKSWQKLVTDTRSCTDRAKVGNRVYKVRGRQTHSLPLVNTQSLEDQANFLGTQFERAELITLWNF